MKPLVFAMATALLPLTVEAQVPISGDLTINVTPQRYRICNDRPERPAWLETVAPREAYRAVTLMALYELRSWESIAASADCSCGTRFPDWAQAEEEYLHQHVSLSQSDQTKLRRQIRKAKSEIASQVEAICRSQGNW